MNNGIAKNKFSIYACLSINALLNLYYLIDMLTGFLRLNNISLSLSVFYKILLFGLMLIVIANDKKDAFQILLWMAFAVLCIFHVLPISTDKVLAMNDLFKLFYCIIIYKYFDKYLATNYSRYTRNIVFWNKIVFFLNMLFALLGFGFTTYGRGVGLKGFFYAGNELGVVVFTLCVISYIRSNNKFAIVVLYSAISLIIGTKTPIFAIWLFYLMANIIGQGRKRIIELLLIAMTIIFVYYNKSILLNLQSVNYQINNIKWHNIQNDTFINSILSGRIDYLQLLLLQMKQNFSILNVIFGFGIPSVISEIDPVDTYYCYGIFMLALQTCFYIMVMWKNRHDRLILSFNIVYLLLACSAGHVWFNTSSILLFSIINTCDIKMYQRKLTIKIGDKIIIGKHYRKMISF